MSTSVGSIILVAPWTSDQIPVMACGSSNGQPVQSQQLSLVVTHCKNSSQSQKVMPKSTRKPNDKYLSVSVPNLVEVEKLMT